MAGILSGIALQAAKATVGSTAPENTLKNRGSDTHLPEKNGTSHNVKARTQPFDKEAFLARMHGGKLKAAVKSATTRQ